MMSSFALVYSFFEKDVLCDSDKQLGPSRQGRISRYTRPQSLEEGTECLCEDLSDSEIGRAHV